MHYKVSSDREWGKEISLDLRKKKDCDVKGKDSCCLQVASSLISEKKEEKWRSRRKKISSS